MIMKKVLIIASFTLLLFQNCTKVDEHVYDKYSADQFYALPVGADAALANVYAQIPGNWGGKGYFGADQGWSDLNIMTSDEAVIPHRNSGDWELDYAHFYMREWLPSEPYIWTVWQWLYNNAIFSANLAVDQLTKANADPSKIAEAKVLRAFFYYLAIDAFGDVPFFTDNNLPPSKIPQAKRADTYNWIVSELTSNIDLLPTQKGGKYYGRFNRMAGYALLAKVYLNGEVLSGTPKYTECLAACDKIINEGGYSLHPGGANATSPLGYRYFELFGDVCPDDETILAIPITVDVVGRNIATVRSLRGTDGVIVASGVGAWNGTVIPPDFVNKFDNNDIRKRQFRFGANPYGPQPTGFLDYNNQLTNIENPGADVNDGARSQKWLPVAPANGGGASNDFAIYRYADILLMKAECILRTNGSNDEANSLVTQVRVRVGLSALPSPLTLMNIYDERGFELTWEGFRRQDMIRFGTFTQQHGGGLALDGVTPNVVVPAVDDHFKIFPIPTNALDANKLLKQNPGY
jgi:hypothetical protein